MEGEGGTEDKVETRGNRNYCNVYNNHSSNIPNTHGSPSRL